MLSFTAPRSLPRASSTGAPYLAEMWREACAELSQRPGRDTVVHDVDISLVHGPEGLVQTRYSIALDTSVGSHFLLERRFGRPTPQDVAVWGRQFADLVSVRTEDHRTLVNYLTRERRSMIVQLLHRFPAAKVSSEDLCVWVNGIEPDRAKVVSNLGQMVGFATILQPSWADVALDERSVMQDLFGSDRDVVGVAQRFEELYRGNVVSWVGEAVQVGEAGHRERWVAILLGSADGRTTSSGRVVAMAAVDPHADMERGDVVSFEGMLVGLDANKRYFRIA